MSWISVTKKLPETGNKVILLQQVSDTRKAQVYGFYASKNTLEYEGGDQWGFAPDYDEETDKFYIPEGFYELVENWCDIAFITISKNEVTHWAPLLKLPEDL